MTLFRTLARTVAAAPLSMLATPAAAATVIDFEGLPTGFYGPSLTIGDVTFSSTTALRVVVEFSAGAPTNGLCPLLQDGDGNNLCRNPLTLSFARPVSDFSIDALDLGIPISALLTLADGSTRLFQFDGSSGSTRTLAFDGLIDIVSARFATPNQGEFGTSYDNVTFTMAAASAVPEPATWAMMIAGFGLIGVRARRRTLAARFA